MNIRAISFRLLDLLKGSPIRKNLSEIEHVIYNQDDIWVKKQTIKLLEHASKTTPFYKPYIGLNELSRFPVIDKNLIEEKADDFFSSSFKKENLKVVSTSGSTGVPFKVFQNREKVIRNKADNIFFNQWFDFQVGERLYYLRIWNEINRMSKLRQVLTNICPVDTRSLDRKSCEVLILQLSKDKKPKSILSYSSSLDALARNIEKHNFIKKDCKVKAIFGMAEGLNKHSREILEDYFSCPVILRYSNSENGFIAHQFDKEKRSYLINKASYIVEIFDLEQDRVLPNGQRGRIVVTDLFNYAQPLIRYDTGDVGIKILENFLGKPMEVLKNIDGRKMDFIINAGGEMISPHVIDYALRPLDGLRQFQIVQTASNEFILKVNLEKRKSFNRNEVVAILKEYLGDQAAIIVEEVEEVPHLSSGKRQIVVNRMNHF